MYMHVHSTCTQKKRIWDAMYNVIALPRTWTPACLTKKPLYAMGHTDTCMWSFIHYMAFSVLVMWLHKESPLSLTTPVPNWRDTAHSPSLPFPPSPFLINCIAFPPPNSFLYNNFLPHHLLSHHPGGIHPHTPLVLFNFLPHISHIHVHTVRAVCSHTCTCSTTIVGVKCITCFSYIISTNRLKHKHTYTCTHVQEYHRHLYIA